MHGQKNIFFHKTRSAMRILIITLIREKRKKKIELPIKIVLKSDLLTERILLEKTITKATN